MALTPHTYITEARDLLAHAYREPDAARKIAAYEEAFEILEEQLGATDVATADRTLAGNLRLAHTRQLLAQLPTLTHVNMNVWFDYVRLLIFDLSGEVESAFQAAPELVEPYRHFIRLWGAEMIDVLQR